MREREIFTMREKLNRSIAIAQLRRASISVLHADLKRELCCVVCWARQLVSSGCGGGSWHLAGRILGALLFICGLRKLLLLPVQGCCCCSCSKGRGFRPAEISARCTSCNAAAAAAAGEDAVVA